MQLVFISSYDNSKGPCKNKCSIRAWYFVVKHVKAVG